MTSELTVSLIIPTYNRERALFRLLTTIASNRDKPSLEIIVCDDGSDCSLQNVISEFSERLPLRYLYQRKQGFRAGSARNMGIEAATGDILLFVDDDLVLPASFFAGHVAAHTNNADIVCLGRRRRVGTMLQHLHADHIGNYLREAEEDDREAIFTSGLDSYQAPWKLLYSCNFSVRRTVPLIYFDDSFHGWGLEDTELGYRLWKSGKRYVESSSAVAIHIDDPTPRDPFRCECLGITPNYDSYLVNCARLLAKYPNDEELRRGILPDLSWYIRDTSTGSWVKDGEWHDPLDVIRQLEDELLVGQSITSRRE